MIWLLRFLTLFSALKGVFGGVSPYAVALWGKLIEFNVIKWIVIMGSINKVDLTIGLYMSRVYVNKCICMNWRQRSK